MIQEENRKKWAKTLRLANEAEQKQDRENKAKFDRLAKIYSVLLANPPPADAKAQLERLLDRGEKSKEWMGQVIAKESAVSQKIASPTDLYIEEYPLPPGVKWGKLGSMEKARMPWIDPDGLYLEEGTESVEYDAEGFPIKPATAEEPIEVKPPRYEKLSPRERERLWWLADRKDQLYLHE